MWRRPLFVYGQRSFTSFIPKTFPRPTTPPKFKNTFGIYHIWHHYRKRLIDPAFAHRPWQDDQWARIYDAPDLSAALALLGYTDGQSPLLWDNTPSSEESGNGLTWLALRLIRDKVHTQQDAIYALTLVSRSLHALPPRVQPCVIVMTAYWAAKFDAAVPLRHAVTTFLGLEPDPPAFQYNILLDALSVGSRGEVTSSLVMTVLDVMLNRRHKVGAVTYTHLLHPKFSTRALVRAIEDHMKAQGFSPSIQHLEVLLNTSRRDGRKYKHREYLTVLRRLQAPQVVEDPLDQVALPERKADEESRVPCSNTDKDLGNERWSHDVLLAACRDPKTSGQRLVALFRQGIAVHGGGWRQQRFYYSITIKGLVDKEQYAMAAELWQELRVIGISLDSVLVAVGVQALTMAGEAHLAFDLLEEVYQRYTQAESEMDAEGLWGPSRARALAKRELPTINSVMLTGFLSSALYISRPDIVFMLWDCLELLYKVPVSVETLNAMLQAARQSRKLADTPRGALAHGFSHFVEKSYWSPEDEISDPRQRHVAKIKRVLKDPSKQTGMWNGEPGYRVGLRVATRVLLWKWPHLADIQTPVYALRSTSDAAMVSPMRELYRSMTSYREVQLRGRPSQLSNLVGEESHLYKYPSIHPSDGMFRNYIHLLDANDLCTEIPLVLAWMRRLDIKPSVRTLATALVYWGGVALDAPLVEAMKGGRDRGPYAKLEGWLLDWVGEDGMPPPGRIGRVMRRIEEYRNGDPQQIGKMGD